MISTLYAPLGYTGISWADNSSDFGGSGAVNDGFALSMRTSPNASGNVNTTLDNGYPTYVPDRTGDANYVTDGAWRIFRTAWGDRPNTAYQMFYANDISVQPKCGAGTAANFFGIPDGTANPAYNRPDTIPMVATYPADAGWYEVNLRLKVPAAETRTGYREWDLVLMFTYS